MDKLRIAGVAALAALLAVLLLGWVAGTHRLQGAASTVEPAARTPGAPSSRRPAVGEPPRRTPAEVPGEGAVETLLVEVGSPGTALLSTMRSSYGFHPTGFLPEDVDWPARATVESIRGHETPNAILEAAGAEGLLAEPGPPGDVDPWALVLRAEVERVQREADRAADREAHVQAIRRELALPDSADRPALIDAVRVAPQPLQDRFWEGLGEADRAAAREPEAARRLVEHPDAPPLARDMGRLYLLEDAHYDQDRALVVDRAFELLRTTDDRLVARQAMKVLQSGMPSLEADRRAELEEYLDEEPDLFGVIAQLGVRAAWEDGAWGEAADWLRRTDAWSRGRCPCADRGVDEAPPGDRSFCQSLCEIDAALRPTLLATGHLEPSGWRDGIRLAATVCHQQAPLDAAVGGEGWWNSGWAWSGWPPGPWTSCFEHERNAPPRPGGPVRVRVEVVPR